MNNQLAQLAAKSGFDVGIHNGMVLGNFADMHRLEKFAELVIDRCKSQCDVIQAGYVDLRKSTDDFSEKNRFSEGSRAALHIKNRIDDTFGI